MQIIIGGVNLGDIPQVLRARLREAKLISKIAARFTGLLLRMAGWFSSITTTLETRQPPTPPAVSQSAPEREKPPALETEPPPEPPPLPQDTPEAKTEGPKSTEKGRNVFAVLHNLQEQFEGTPTEITESFASRWFDGKPDKRACVAAYHVSAEGTEHMDALLVDTGQVRFSTIQKVFPTIHLELLKGTKQQALDYIQKRGKHADSNGKVLHVARRGDIKDNPGQRTDIKKDMELIPVLIEQGLTPEQVMDVRFSLRKYDRLIRDAYNRKRFKETPSFREVFVRWHYGAAGTGKSRVFTKLCEQEGDEKVYFTRKYKNGFDKYCGQPILFFDELKGESQLSYADLLALLDGYRDQVDCRYSNNFQLWNTVEITSVFSPYEIYNDYVLNRERDTFEQLERRIDSLVFHYKDGDGNLCEHEFPLNVELDYESLMRIEIPKLQGEEPLDYGGGATLDPNIVEALFPDLEEFR